MRWPVGWEALEQWGADVAESMEMLGETKKIS
jgi:hypothetical protein